MNQYDVFYERISRGIREKGMEKFIALADTFLTLLFYIVYIFLVFLLFYTSDARLLKFILVPGLSFLCVSVMRKMINVPRPYETWDITPLIKREGKGKSMPSRHTFSATVISFCYIAYCLPYGIILLILALTEGMIRVISGVHYPKDVIAGILCGIIAGLFLLF